MSQAAARNVIVYRDFLLPPSETFIRSQAEGLSRFSPYYLGLRRTEGLDLPPDRVITIQRDGKLGQLNNGCFRLVGITPLAAWQVLNLGPSLIHAHFGVDGSRIMRLARYLRLPMIVTLHDYDVTTSDADLLRLMPYSKTYIRRRPRLNRQVTRFLAVSEFLKQKAIARGFSEEKIRVHYIGINADWFEPAPVAGRAPVVLFVGRLVAKKGCDDLIDAMASVQVAHPAVELVIIGDGELRSALEARAAAKLRKYRFLGRQDPAEVRAWQRRAQLFCAPSVTAPSGETEGLPISILEAMATGTPVVSTRHAGIPEAIIDGETGLLVAEHDSQGLGEAIARVLANADFAQRLASAARELVCTKFDLKRQTSKLEDHYEDAIRVHRQER